METLKLEGLPEVAKGNESQGMNQLTKDRFDLAAKTVAILGGIVSAVALVITLQGSIAQSSTEHRWNQSKLAMELVNGILSDPQAFDALRMIDWTSRKYQTSKDVEQEINTKEFADSLNIKNNERLSDKGIYVRECFDRLFYHLGKLERAIDTELVRFGDVRTPIGYYVPFLYGNYNDVIWNYMKQLGDDDAIKLLERFPHDSRIQDGKTQNQKRLTGQRGVTNE